MHSKQPRAHYPQGAAEGRPVTPAGGQWLWRLRRGLRLSTVDGGAATDSPTTWVAAPSGSASASVRECRSLGTACWWWCAPGGDDPSPRRRGISKVSRLTRRSSPPAPFPAARLRSYACYRCVARSSATWTCSAVLDPARLLERALRGSAYLPDRARSLRAMDRLPRVDYLNARSCVGAVTIVAGTTVCACDLAR